MKRKGDRLQQIESSLSIIGSRLHDLRKQRDDLEATLRRKRKPETRDLIAARIAVVDSQIKAAETEEWEADDERYDLIWRR